MKIQKLYNKLPHVFQELSISLFNYLAYKNRYGSFYKAKLKELKHNSGLPLAEIKEIQRKKLINFLRFTKTNSNFYKKFWKDVEANDDLTSLPILEKSIFKKHIENIKTISKDKGIVAYTGGTTGKALKVVYTKQDMQERFAYLDHFRSQFGYSLGQKIAWFSGKTILTDVDVYNNRFWKTDHFHKVRYYSTFHMNDNTLYYYLKNLMKFNPKFISGFPTSIRDVATYGIANKIDFDWKINAIFTTSETVTPDIREVIENFFKCKIYNQYASSEGAPFIFECKNGNLHLELQSGVFEVLDENENPTDAGRLLVTSFNSHGTPLVRYDIGDNIILSDKNCNCGNNNPLVKGILGRSDDFLFSPQTGKINLVNTANGIKDLDGIKAAQFIQDDINEIKILIVPEAEKLSEDDYSKLISNWKERLGKDMKISVSYVNSIPKESSGKFRLIKNSLK